MNEEATAKRKIIFKHSYEARLKISLASKLRIRKPHTEETKRKISESLKKKKGDN